MGGQVKLYTHLLRFVKKLNEEEFVHLAQLARLLRIIVDNYKK